MAATITVMDPVTRIEGHMKIELTIDTVGGVTQVTDARCTGTLFRGFELLLQGRDPMDAPILTERICGVCPVSHGTASVLAIDAASGKTVPTNGRVLRNLVLGANFIQSHILHFYLLAALDYVAGPATAPWTPAWDVDMRGGVSDIATHLPLAIEARRRAHEMGAVFGGRMPNPHTYVPGGFTATPTAADITKFRTQLNWLIPFIRDTYIADVEMLSSIYPDFHQIGKGYGNLLAYGVFDTSDTAATKLLRRGYVLDSNPTKVNNVVLNSITESVTYSWYDNSTNYARPATGDTLPVYPKGSAYSWLKAPRYAGLPFETGPLARMWVSNAYRQGVSVMDRHLARAKEALKVAVAMRKWLTELTVGDPVCNAYDVPASGTGIGLTEAPRGALGHWVSLSGGKIANYQVITPTCWNASPMDTKKQHGPLEQALIGTPITEPDRPIEALRVIHSFDPCMSCAVHVMRPGGKPVVLRAGVR